MLDEDLDLEDSPEDFFNVDSLPSVNWLCDNFRRKSAAIRYLASEYKASVKDIAAHMGIPYRQVFGVVARMKKSQSELPKHICPVCRNRK